MAEHPIDAQDPALQSEEARLLLEQNPGAWKVISTAPELLLALRDREQGLLPDLRQLNPASAVLAGDLAEMSPSDLLNFLHQGRRTGILLTRSGGAERGIVILEGNVAWAASTVPAERLGAVLVSLGMLKREVLDVALSAQQADSTHRRLGQLLLDQRLIKLDDLQRALRLQVTEIFLGLLVLRGGSFVFLRGVDRQKLPVALAMDTQGLLLDGLRRLDEMKLYRTRVPSGESRLKPSGKPLPAGDEALGADIRRVLVNLDGRRTLLELATASSLGEFEATRAAFKLLEGGYAELSPEPPPPAPAG